MAHYVWNRKCLKTIKNLLQYTCAPPASQLVGCFAQFQQRLPEECQDVANTTIAGLRACEADIIANCDGNWGIGMTFKTPVHCLVSLPEANVTQACAASDMMQFASTLHHKWHKRPRCVMFAWVVGFLIIGSGTLWIVLERRRRSRDRQLRWASEGTQPTAQGMWTTGLFGSWHRCLPDWHTCLPSFLWPMFQSALSQAELRDRDCTLGDVCANITWAQRFANIFRTRQELRARYDMPTAPLRDCMTSAFCQPCALAQHAREIEIRQTASTHQINSAYAAQVGVPLVEGTWQPAKQVFV